MRLAKFPCEQGSRSDRVVRGAGGDLDARATSSLMFAAPTGRSVAGRDGFAAWQERRPFYAGSGAQTRGTSPGVVERTRCSTLRVPSETSPPGNTCAHDALPRRAVVLSPAAKEGRPPLGGC